MASSVAPQVGCGYGRLQNREMSEELPVMKLNRALLIRLLCVALVAAVMIPLGNAVFPYVSGELDGTQFQAIEAVLSATLGFGIHALIG
jgi:hypothetical protein